MVYTIQKLLHISNTLNITIFKEKLQSEFKYLLVFKYRYHLKTISNMKIVTPSSGVDILTSYSYAAYVLM